MSRTFRSLENDKNYEYLNPGQIQKIGLPKYSSKRSRHGKAKVGPGGIGCICCTKCEPHKLKKWARKANRHEFCSSNALRNIDNDFDDSNDTFDNINDNFDGVK